MTDTLETSAQAKVTTWALCRCSDAKQDTASQAAAIAAWAETNGIPIAKWIGRDEAVHGDALVRNDLAEIERAAASKPRQLDRLLVYHTDRVGRRGPATQLWIEDLVALGVELVSVSEGGVVDATSEDGEFMLSIKAAIARKERRRIGARTRAACVLRDGVKVSARRGLKWGRPSITIAPETEAMIRAERAKPFQQRKTWDELAKIVRGTVTRPDGSTASVSVSDNFLRTHFS